MSRNELLDEWNTISYKAASVLTTWIEFSEKYKDVDDEFLDGLTIGINSTWALFIRRVDDQDDDHDDDHNDMYKNN